MSHVTHHLFSRIAASDNKAVMRGVTLIELMVVVAITAILAAIAVPQYSQFIGSRAIDAQASAFMSSFRLARSEALKRSTPVTLCPSNNPEAATPTCNAAVGALGWATGWLMFTDLGVRGTIDGNDTIIRVQPAFNNSGGMLPIGIATITFAANGIPVGGSATGSFELRNKAAPNDISARRFLILSSAGSIRLSK